MSALLETWLVQEYADKGSLADAIAAGRFRRKLDGSVDVIAILKCLNDVAAGACAPPSFSSAKSETVSCWQLCELESEVGTVCVMAHWIDCLLSPCGDPPSR